ncbi:serine protease, partial [Streptomyces sp. TRM76130]|nr:serine protease [Streptomyces sp. TRM76130]
LLSAAEQQRVDLTPAKLRTALTSTADHIEGVQAYEEGAGLIDVVAAWKSIRRGASAHEYTVKAPVDTSIDYALETPGYGTGLYDREGGLKAGQKKTYEVTVARTSGADKAIRHELSFANNAGGTFEVVGSDTVKLPLNQPVTVKVRAAPRSEGLKSAILEVDDPGTEGVDKQVLTTVVVAPEVKYTYSASGSVQRNSTASYFVTVPEGARTLEVAIGGLKGQSQTRFVTIHPYGVPVDTTSTPYCYNNYLDGNGCAPDVRSYAEPQPGVWEIEVESRRTSPLLDNPYRLDVAVLGADFDPEVVTVPEAVA